VLIGAIIGAVVGGVAAHNAGGNVLAGIAIGAVIGAAVGGMSSYVGGIMMEGFKATSWAGLSIGQGALIGATTGAISGFGIGVVAGYAGGKGSAGSMFQSGASGAMWGATSGAVTGAASTALAKASSSISNLPDAAQETASEGVREGNFEKVGNAVEKGTGKPIGLCGNEKAAIISETAASGNFGSGAVGPGGFYDESGIFHTTIGQSEPLYKPGLLRHIGRTAHKWLSTYVVHVQDKVGKPGGDPTAVFGLDGGAINAFFDVAEAALEIPTTGRSDIMYYGHRLSVLSDEIRHSFGILRVH